MPSGADRSLSISLCIALAAHVLFALILIEAYTSDVRAKLEAGTFFAPFPRHDGNREFDDAILVPDVDSPQAWRAFGERDGTGEGTHRADGTSPLSGPLSSQDQPLLSRDPVGAGDIGNLPSASLEPQALIGGEGDLTAGRSGRRELSPITPATDERMVLFGPPQPLADHQPKPPKSSPGVAVATKARVESPLTPDPGSTSVAQHSPVGEPDASSSGGQPVAHIAPADPAPLSDSEVDAFSTKRGNVLIQGGKVEPRLGRKVKTVRPRLNLASLGSILSLADPVLRVGIRFDDTGKVQHVTLLQSSGSNELDQPTVVALYDWWFEPLPDRAGKLQGDTIVLSISFR